MFRRISLDELGRDPPKAVQGEVLEASPAPTPIVQTAPGLEELKEQVASLTRQLDVVVRHLSQLDQGALPASPFPRQVNGLTFDD